MAEDDEAFLTTRIQCHEHVHIRLCLHSSELTATIAGDPALAVVGHVHLRRIIAARDIRYCHAAAALLQKPADKLPAPTPLFEGASDKAAMANVLQNSTSGSLQLLPCGAFLAECVAQLVISKNNALGVKSFDIGTFFSEAFSEHARLLVLDRAHHHELRSSPRTLIAKNNQRFLPTAPFPFILAHEEHEHAKVFLHP